MVGPLGAALVFCWLIGRASRGFVVATGAVAIALAALSWHAFEAPLDRLRRHFPYQRASEQRSAPGLRAPAAQQTSP